MLLCTPDSVLKLIGIGAAGADHLSNTRPAVQIASRAIEDYLETVLPQQTQTDFYDNSRANFRWDITTPERLRLVSSFVQGDAVVRYSTDGMPLRSATDGEVLDPSYYITNKEQGIVQLLAKLPNQRVGIYSGISVTYTSGFDVDNVDGELLTDLPGWMVDAAMTLAVYLLKILPANAAQRTASIRGQKPGMLEQEAGRMAQSMIVGYARPRVNLRYPAWNLVAP